MATSNGAPLVRPDASGAVKGPDRSLVFLQRIDIGERSIIIDFYIPFRRRVRSND